MKPTLPCLAAAVCLALPARAQEEVAPARNLVAVNAPLAVFGLYAASYERAFTRSLGVAAEATYAASTSQTSAGSRQTVRGFGFTLAPRYYFTGHAPEGFFAGPELTWVNLEADVDGAQTRGNSLLVGAVGGYRFVFFQHLAVTPALGAHAAFGPVSVIGPLPGGFGVGPLLRLDLGAAF